MSILPAPHARLPDARVRTYLGLPSAQYLQLRVVSDCEVEEHRHTYDVLSRHSLSRVRGVASDSPKSPRLVRKTLKLQKRSSDPSIGTGVVQPLAMLSLTAGDDKPARPSLRRILKLQLRPSTAESGTSEPSPASSEAARSRISLASPKSPLTSLTPGGAPYLVSPVVSGYTTADLGLQSNVVDFEGPYSLGVPAAVPLSSQPAIYQLMHHPYANQPVATPFQEDMCEVGIGSDEDHSEHPLNRQKGGATAAKRPRQKVPSPVTPSSRFRHEGHASRPSECHSDGDTHSVSTTDVSEFYLPTAVRSAGHGAHFALPLEGARILDLDDRLCATLTSLSGKDEARHYDLKALDALQQHIDTHASVSSCTESSYMDPYVIGRTSASSLDTVDQVHAGSRHLLEEREVASMQKLENFLADRNRMSQSDRDFCEHVLQSDLFYLPAAMRSSMIFPLESSHSVGEADSAENSVSQERCLSDESDALRAESREIWVMDVISYLRSQSQDLRTSEGQLAPLADAPMTTAERIFKPKDVSCEAPESHASLWASLSDQTQARPILLRDESSAQSTSVSLAQDGRSVTSTLNETKTAVSACDSEAGSHQLGIEGNGPSSSRSKKPLDAYSATLLARKVRHKPSRTFSVTSVLSAPFALNQTPDLGDPAQSEDETHSRISTTHTEATIGRLSVPKRTAGAATRPSRFTESYSLNRDLMQFMTVTAPGVKVYPSSAPHAQSKLSTL